MELDLFKAGLCNEKVFENKVSFKTTPSLFKALTMGDSVPFHFVRRLNKV